MRGQCNGCKKRKLVHVRIETNGRRLYLCDACLAALAGTHVRLPEQEPDN